MSCDRSGQIHSYHDGELPAESRGAVEAHLRECADCAALLEDLRRMSRTLVGAPRARMSSDAINRMEQAWWRQRDRGVLRLAESLTGIAAAVLVGALVFWSDAGSNHNDANISQASVWQTAALMPPQETRDDAASETVALVQWMADDLSPEPLPSSR